jgi:hypothetical protein
MQRRAQAWLCRVYGVARNRQRPTDKIAGSGWPRDAQRGEAACCSVAGDRPCGFVETVRSTRTHLAGELAVAEGSLGVVKESEGMLVSQETGQAVNIRSLTANEWH